jgi:hypothetical protein
MIHKESQVRHKSQWTFSGKSANSRAKHLQPSSSKEVREYYAAAKTAAKQRLTLWLKKNQTGWIVARKA